MSQSDPIRLTGAAIDEEPPAAGRIETSSVPATQECKWCNVEGPPEWSPYANTWIHRRKTVDKPCSNPPKDAAAHAEGLRLLNIARGCHDYQGGYSEPRESEIYHHGIQTVAQALTAAMVDRDALQVRVLESIGQRGVAFPAGKCPGCDQPMLPEGEVKLPDEYDHAQGCPYDASATQECECPARKQIQRNCQGYQNLLEFRKLSGEVGGQRDGYGGRYGALTREEIESVIAENNAALSAPCPCAQLRQERDDALLTELDGAKHIVDLAKQHWEEWKPEEIRLRAELATLTALQESSRSKWGTREEGLQFAIANVQAEGARQSAQRDAALSLLDQAREALARAYRIASGEDQAASDDTGGMEVIAREVSAALAKIDAARKPPRW